MTHLAAALFFAFALLAALVAIQMTVRFYWRDIVLALRGELGLPVTRAPAPPAAFGRRPHAAS